MSSRPAARPGFARPLIGTLVLLLAGLSFAQEVPPVRPTLDLPETPWEVGAPPQFPALIVKRPGLNTAQEWREAIDAYWGEGVPGWIKLAIFDRFWEAIDGNFACFQDLDVDWQALRDRYEPEVFDGVSRGRFAAILNHLALALRESHTRAWDYYLNYFTKPSKGVPLMLSGVWGGSYSPSADNSHFGACLTPLPDGSLLVYRVAAAHPLGLEPGDVVLGYDGIAWKDLYPALLQAELPFTGLVGSSPISYEHSLLMGAGLNWHLFDTIDVLKYGTEETQHLSTSLLEGKRSRQ